MPQFTVKFDDQNKSLVKALEKRTAVLEKMLTQINQKKTSPSVVKIVNKAPDMQAFNKMTSSLLSAIKKTKTQKIVTRQDTTGLSRALNERIAFLEKMLRNQNNPDKLVATITINQTRQIREM